MTSVLGGARQKRHTAPAMKYSCPKCWPPLISPLELTARLGEIQGGKEQINDTIRKQSDESGTQGVVQSRPLQQASGRKKGRRLQM